MTFSSPITARAKRVLRADHIRRMLKALAAWRALPADRRANLIAYLTTDDIITTREEREAAAELIASVDATFRAKESKR